MAFKQYMGITPKISNWNNSKTEFSIILDNNPLAENVELGDCHKGLWYSNVICGIVRGCLEMVVLGNFFFEGFRCNFKRVCTLSRMYYMETAPQSLGCNFLARSKKPFRLEKSLFNSLYLFGFLYGFLLLINWGFL